MKIKIVSAALLIGLIAACGNPKDDEKKELSSLLKVHDEVMANSEAAMKNKMGLDSLIKINGADKDKTFAITSVKNQLISADEAMETWMHQFNADNSGKSHREIMDYLASQRRQLLHVDTLLKSAIDQSNKYLSK